MNNFEESEFIKTCIKRYESYSKYQREYKRKHPEFAKNFYAKHKDDPEFKQKASLNNKSYYEKNKEKIIARSKARQQRIKQEKINKNAE